jgi:hypothetical protein
MVVAGSDDALPVGRERRPPDPVRVAPSSASSWPVAAFHTRAVLSKLAVTMRCPSGENAAWLTSSVWPSSLARSWPVAAFHIRAVCFYGTGGLASIGSRGGSRFPDAVKRAAMTRIAPRNSSGEYSFPL